MSDGILSQEEINSILQGDNDEIPVAGIMDSEEKRTAFLEAMTDMLSYIVPGFTGCMDVLFYDAEFLPADGKTRFLDMGEEVVMYTSWTGGERGEAFHLVFPRSLAGYMVSLMAGYDPPGPVEAWEDLHFSLLRELSRGIASSISNSTGANRDIVIDPEGEFALEPSPGALPLQDDRDQVVIRWKCGIKGLVESDFYLLIGPVLLDALTGEDRISGELDRKLNSYVDHRGKKGLKDKEILHFYQNDLTSAERRELMGDDYSENMSFFTRRRIMKRLKPRVREMIRTGKHAPKKFSPLDKEIVSFPSQYDAFRFLISLRFEDDLVSASDIDIVSWQGRDPEYYLGREGVLLMGKREIARVVLKKNKQDYYVEVLDKTLPGKEKNLDKLLLETPISLSVEIARTVLPLEDLNNLGKNSIIEYDRLAGEPFDILMEEYDRVIAKGEVVVVDENLGVRVTDIPEGTIADRTLPGNNLEDESHDSPAVTVRCIAGKTTLELRELVGLGEASIMELDRPAGSPFDLVLGDDVVLRGEIVVINENIGVRITEDTGDAYLHDETIEEPEAVYEPVEEDPYEKYANRDLIKKVKKTLKDDPELITHIIDRFFREPFTAVPLLVILGEDLAAQLIEQLDEDTVMELVRLISHGEKRVSEEEGRQALKVFLRSRDTLKRELKIEQEYIRNVLKKSLGKKKAESILKKISTPVQPSPMAFLQHVNHSNLLNFIQGEHPQTIALLLSMLDSTKSALIMSGMEPQLQADVARRIAFMDRVSPDILREVERVLERKLSTLAGENYIRTGGIESIVDVLSSVDRGTERIIIEALEEEEPELANEIRKRTIIFEDVVHMDDRSMQKVMRELDLQVMSHALKGASEEVKKKFFRNMSERAGNLLKEDMECIAAIRLEDVEKAQARILAAIRELEESEDIIIVRPGEEDLIE
jgi:flagellar motor switch protein FliG